MGDSSFATRHASDVCGTLAPRLRLLAGDWRKWAAHLRNLQPPVVIIGDPLKPFLSRVAQVVPAGIPMQHLEPLRTAARALYHARFSATEVGVILSSLYGAQKRDEVSSV